jgi:O-antigen ligase
MSAGKKVLSVGHALFAFSIPFSQKINNIGIAALVICSMIVVMGRRVMKPGYFLITAALLMATLCLIMLSSVAPVNEAFGDLQKFIPFLLFPGLMALTGSTLREGQIRELAFWSFSSAIALVCIYCLMIGIYNFVALEPSLELANEDYFNRILSSWNYLSYERLAAPSHLHPAYLSLFISLSIFYLLTIHSYRFVRVVMIVILVLFMLLLAARTGIIASIITFVAYLYMKNHTEGVAWRKYTLWGSVVIVALSGLLFWNDVFRKRITDSMTFDTDVDVESWNALNLRLAIWKCNLAIGTQHPFTGIGFDDDIRNSCYDKYSFYPHYGTGFNAHNQFLEFFVVGGFGLLLLLILYLGIPWMQALKARDSLLVLFVLLVCVNLMTECMLSRIKGVVFICYFLSLCYYSPPKNSRS